MFGRKAFGPSQGATGLSRLRLDLFDVARRQQKN